jgi:RNAse (barnase) inhibitor barstar
MRAGTLFICKRRAGPRIGAPGLGASSSRVNLRQTPFFIRERRNVLCLEMMTAKVSLDCNNIRDWDSFHEEFARVFGFPDFYGRNMNAWIDCLTSLDAPEDGMSSVHCEPGSVVTLELANVKAFANRCPEQYSAVIECAAFVNWRRLEMGDPSVLALSFHD